MPSKNLVLIGLVAAITASAAPKQVGTMPVPVITMVTTLSTATFDPSSGVYQYTYTVTSGSQNKGNIWMLDMDDRAPADYVPPRSSGRYTLRRGARGIVPFDQERDAVSYMLNHFAGTLVELGIEGPEGWMGSVTAGGDVGLFYAGREGKILSPGTSTSFIITSPNQPVIRDLVITPDWTLVVDDEADEEQESQAAEVEQELLIQRSVLAPGAEWPGSREHWEHFKNDIAKARQLGWIMDASFADGVQTQLAAARHELDTQGPQDAVPTLRTLLASIDAGTPTQRTDTANALLKLNTEALIAHIADTPASKPTGQFTPRLSLTPEKQSPALGTTATVTARLVDKGNKNGPIAGYPLELRVVAGQGSGQVVKGVTDASGELAMTLTSDKPGGQIVELRDKENLLFAQVNWGGGARLVLEYLFPPSIHLTGQRTIDVEEQTGNWGDEPAEPSVTRYYVSKTWGFNPAAVVVGERKVPALQPHESSTNKMQLTLPMNLDPGSYFLLACADAGHPIPADAGNNRCSVQGAHAAKMAAPAGH